tara:strand:+ start:34793 stop:35032 length:240 start_codon:yes stop_codon:yes gene_type:complete
MFDPLKKEKAKVQQAKINAELAKKYSQRQFEKAKYSSKSFISSPTGIAGMFVAGSINGATSDVPKPISSVVVSLLLKLF